jgi:hypothetical protein
LPVPPNRVCQNPKPETRNPKSETRNSKQTRNPNLREANQRDQEVERILDPPPFELRWQSAAAPALLLIQFLLVPPKQRPPKGFGVAAALHIFPNGSKAIDAVPIQQHNFSSDAALH